MDQAPGFVVAEQTLDAMRLRSASADPLAYHVFHTHVTGENPGLSAALDALFARHDALSPAQTTELYEAHLSPNRLSNQADTASGVLLGELGSLIQMIEGAIGSQDSYSRSLVSITEGLDETTDGKRLAEMVRRLLVATRETMAANAELRGRLRATRSEIEDLRETLETVRTETLTDPLTTLANRKHLDGMLLRCVDHAALSGEPLSVLMLDVDHFKQFNDRWGHLTGDQVLRLVSMSIKGESRPSDTAARFGGEEFAVLLPKTTLRGACIIAERIRQTVMSRELVKRSTGEALGRLTVSIGAASFSKGDTAALLLDRADKCLLEAKRSGRNRTVSERDMPASAEPPVGPQGTASAA